MSDFLSNFTKDNYDGKKKTEAPSESPIVEAKTKATDVSTEETSSEPMPQKAKETKVEANAVREANELNESKETKVPDDFSRNSRRQKKKEAVVSRYQTEETEFDPTYKKKQQKKYALIGSGSLLAVLLLSFLYYQLTHVKVPDFVGKEISVVRTWGNEEGVKIEVTQSYNFDVSVNQVIEQSVKAKQKIRKGKTLTIEGSLGPNPEEKISLPDFTKMGIAETKKWLEDNKVENATLIESYDDTIEKGQFIKQEFGNKELKAEDYQRKDRLMVYYSKGVEVFEKNIELPDFTGKTLTEAEEWAKKNGVKITAVKDFSNTVALNTVISQEIAAKTKMAKNETLTLSISKGKALEVPDFSQYTMEEASQLQGKVPTVIKNQYSATVPFGYFMSQSVAAGEQYDETADLPTVIVVYSQGKPYLKDLRGSLSEGDLAKHFFDEYQSKGANVNYSVYYVDSAQPKGTVVEMSSYGQFIGLEATIWVGISLGNLTQTSPEVPELPETSIPTKQSQATQVEK